MRSSSVQFKLWTRPEALAFLASCPKTADTHGDRLSALRSLEPVTTERERRDAREWNRKHPRKKERNAKRVTSTGRSSVETRKVPPTISPAPGGGVAAPNAMDDYKTRKKGSRRTTPKKPKPAGDATQGTLL